MKTGRGSFRGRFLLGMLLISFMPDRNKILENLQEWLKNPFWAEYYHSAPSDRCRQFIALEFHYSETEAEEAGEAMDAIEEQMNAEELRHLMNCCGNNPRKGILARKIAEREKESGG